MKKLYIILSVVFFVLALVFGIGFLHSSNTANGLKNTVKTLKSEVSGLKADAEVNQNTISELTKQTEGDKETIGSLTADAAEKDTQIETLTADVTERDSQIESLTADAAEKDTQIESLTADVTERDSQIESLTADVTERESQIESLTADAAEKDTQIETLTADVADRDSQIESLKAEVAEKDTQIQILSVTSQAQSSEPEDLSSVTQGTFNNTKRLIRVLDREGMRYTVHETAGSGGEDVVELSFRNDSREGHEFTYTVKIYLSSDNTVVSYRVWNLIDYASSSADTIPIVCDDLNYRWKWVVFYSDPSDNSVTAAMDFVTGDWSGMGDVIFTGLVHLDNVLSVAYDTLMPYEK